MSDQGLWRTRLIPTKMQRVWLARRCRRACIQTKPARTRRNSPAHTAHKPQPTAGLTAARPPERLLTFLTNTRKETPLITTSRPLGQTRWIRPHISKHHQRGQTARGATRESYIRTDQKLHPKAGGKWKRSEAEPTPLIHKQGPKRRRKPAARRHRAYPELKASCKPIQKKKQHTRPHKHAKKRKKKKKKKKKRKTKKKNTLHKKL